MQVLITGGKGQLGQALERQFGENAIVLDRQSFDITNVALITERLDQLQPQVIINCAAYTNVDQAQREPKECTAINGDAVAVLAKACELHGAMLVQISTDYVFGGDHIRRVPYLESDPAAPQSVYALSKLQGEYHALQYRHHLIIRTCGLYGRTSKQNNFVEKILTLAKTRDCLRVVDDQQCTPTSVDHLAIAVRFLIETGHRGLIHVVSAGDTNWHEFAEEILRLTSKQVRLERVTSAQFGAIAKRPSFSVLDTTKYRSLGGPDMPHWKEALEEYLMSRSHS